MKKTVAPTRAVRELLDISRAVGLSSEVGLLFALSWLAAGRLTAAGWTGNSQIQALATEEYWHSTLAELLPSGVQEVAWSRGIGTAERLAAVAAVARLVEESGTDGWQVRDVAWEFAGSVAALAPELCDLAFDVLNSPPSSTIWLPFETTGQLAGRALHRGLKTVCAGPAVGSNVLARLVVLIEAQSSEDISKVSFELPSDTIESGKSTFTADFLIAVPPFGARVPIQSGWRKWEAPAPDTKTAGLYRSAAGTTQLVLERSDAWSIAAFWPRVERQALFIVSPNVLFARGQEQRLRECLLAAPSNVQAVVGLPPRQTATGAFAPAAIHLSREDHWRTVRLVDATGLTEDSRSSMRSGRRLLSQRVLEGLRTGQPSEIVADLAYEDAAAHDSILTPARYVGRQHDDQAGPRVRLGDLVTLVRPPAVVKGGQTLLVHEVGITDLDGWNALQPPFGKAPDPKTAEVLAKRLPEFALREGDLVVSTKGSVGRTGIVGAVASADHPNIVAEVLAASPAPTSESPVVVSQSCVALRPKDDVDPELLLLYLRSKSFREQIERLKVGAGIAHVSPSSLLGDIYVPVLDAGGKQAHLEHLKELRHLETAVREATARARNIEQLLFEEEAGTNITE